MIIDEVHERSVDTDLLCLLCRRLLTTNPRIRFVLMSATLAAALFQEYFGVREPVIKVGARRFPVDEVYLGDLGERFKFPAREAKFLELVMKECLEMGCGRPPSNGYMEKLYTVVASLATLVGKPGSAVLIFVAGMNDIVAITELLEQFYVPGINFTAFPIHSDIPFEEQMEAFVPPRSDEVKVIIATNAAESSVTLPNVDHVICLGLCKQIVYNEASHRQMLLPTWISKASATQRTGRVRPGTVYRMYHRDNYEDDMLPFEPGELLRTPLDSVILMLKQILPDENVTEVLQGCLEPPNISTIDRSFESLHNAHFITSPDALCLTTKLGSFVSALGIDLTLGSLIGLGIQFGIGSEAIQMAAILSFPKGPWLQSNPLIHEPASYNGKLRWSISFKL
jgi:HrpA-like RNA helicase